MHNQLQQGSSESVRFFMQKMTHNLSIALIVFSFAWFCLTVGAFTLNPIGPLGIFFVCIGVLCIIISIVFLARYAYYSKKVHEEADKKE
jgi:hypothetical protein